MKVAHSSYRLHVVKREKFGPKQLLSLFTEPEHLYPGQRDHQKTLKNRKHVHGPLVGNSRSFAAVYVLDLQSLMGIDGYHRAAGLAVELSNFLPDQPPFVDTYVVQTMADADRLFEQFNSLAAAKKATCWFTSGLRECKVLTVVKSQLVWKRGRATAAQHAAGMLGSAHTKKATMAVVPGILVVDSFLLTAQHHELVGTVGAYYAIAQHCKDRELVEDFVRGVNQRVFEPVRTTVADGKIKTYRETLAKTPKTGGTPNSTAFSHALFAFAAYAYAKRRKSLASTLTTEAMNLSEFKRVISAL